uniref:S phase cyclin A-associated protein in the endoplasmic reticulum-like n=1 Tax=Sinocyclocheilus grahami TaxID=75366 RepID=A0A672SP22_SINGR
MRVQTADKNITIIHTTPVHQLMSYGTSFQRSNSHDKVRKIVAEEGRAARNLIAWSVPVENKEEEAKSKNHSNGNARAQRINSGLHRNKKQVLKCESCDNLTRKLSELTANILSPQEVLMMLDNYVRDFKALIDWIQLQEKLEKTDAQNRPTSLAWEVRKMSPGRHVMSSPSSDRIVPSPGVRRALNFGGPPPTLAVARLSHTGPSWADRVKCSQSLPVPSPSVNIPAEKPAKKDAEGWETVQRGRSMRPRSNTMVAKVSPVLPHVSPKDDSDKENQRIQPSPQEKSQEVREQEQPVCQEQRQETEKTSVIEPQSMAEVLAKKEELADRLEKANEEAIASAIAEEEQLTREIQAENNELETDNESDFSASIGSGSCGLNLDWSEMLADYDAREPWRQSISWGDMVEEEPARPPGHGIHMHEKLSSPSRKRKKFKLPKKKKNIPEMLSQLRIARNKVTLILRRKKRQQEKERAREDAARERARDREERLAALSASQQEAMEELQKKIQMKHDESSRRHMEQIEQRKEKAAELSSGRHANTDYAPKLTPYERQKQCSLCNVVITSEVHLFSHIKGKRHQQAVRDSSSIQGRELSDEEVEHLSLKKYIMDIMTDSSVPSDSAKEGEERQKARKKAKKLRARMNSRAKEYETCMEAKTQTPDSPYKAKLQRLVKDLVKQQQGQDSGQWASNKVSGLDRTLGELSRILEKQNNADQVAFQVGGGLSALEQILQVVTAASSPTAVPRIPLKSLCTAVNTYYLSCVHCHNNCSYVLYSNKITFLMDLLLHQLTLFVPDEDNSIFGRSVNKQVFEGLTTGLLQTVAKVLGQLHPPNLDGDPPRICTPDAKSKPVASENFNTRTQDLISYVVNMGLIDKLYGCFLSIQGPIDESPKMAAFLEQATAVLHGMCKLCFAVTGRSLSVFDNKRQDPTGLTALLQSTDLVGVLHMLYCTLLHSALPDSLSAGPVGPQEPYSPNVIQVALQGLRFLNTFALLDLSAFQCVLGAEGLSLAFRHIASSLLWYCSQHSSEELLHELIICVGYFTVNHPDNQVIVQSGRQPSVLQKLCQLPFQYFSHPRLIKVLFPSLICACYNNLQNKVILQQEMSCVLLATFIQDCATNENQPDSKASHLEKGWAPLDYCELSNRFPRDQWDSALQFFLKKQEE